MHAENRVLAWAYTYGADGHLDAVSWKYTGPRSRGQFDGRIDVEHSPGFVSYRGPSETQRFAVTDGRLHGIQLDGASGKRWELTYAQERPIALTGDLGGGSFVNKYLWDPRGRLVGVESEQIGIDPKTAVHTFVWNAEGRLISVSDENGVAAVEYDCPSPPSPAQQRDPTT